MGGRFTQGNQAAGRRRSRLCRAGRSVRPEGTKRGAAEPRDPRGAGTGAGTAAGARAERDNEMDGG